MKKTKPMSLDVIDHSGICLHSIIKLRMFSIFVHACYTCFHCETSENLRVYWKLDFFFEFMTSFTYNRYHLLIKSKNSILEY